MTTPLERINLDDPASNRPQREVGKVHPPPSKVTAAADSLPGKIHPAPVPLTFGETFGAMFLAILAAAAVIWIVVWIVHVRQNRGN
jgi:hypothetical protein